MIEQKLFCMILQQCFTPNAKGDWEIATMIVHQIILWVSAIIAQKLHCMILHQFLPKGQGGLGDCNIDYAQIIILAECNKLYAQPKGIIGDENVFFCLK
jgi:hypothetical protein